MTNIQKHDLCPDEIGDPQYTLEGWLAKIE